MPSTTLSRRTVPLWAVIALLACVAVIVWVLARAGMPATEAGAASPSGVVATASADPGLAPSGRATPDSGLPTVAESALPRQAADTLALIRDGGPYPYDADNGVFQNRERLLPARPRGYYREFTVPTPGEDDRGPRRIVRGSDGDLYWTTDHYDSFRQIQEGQ